MIWEAVTSTIIFMVFGYLVGSLSTAIIASKILANDDVRRHGSGNAGATNINRTYGIAAGIIVFLIDVAKPVLVVTIASLPKNYADTTFFAEMSLPAIGFSAIIGHVYPIFFNFKGGKGAASFVGLVVVTEWILVLIGAVIFCLIVWQTRTVALGSIIGSATLIPMQVGSAFIEPLHAAWADPFNFNGSEWWIATIFLVAAWVLLIWRHRGNINRILAKTERKIGKPKGANLR